MIGVVYKRWYFDHNCEIALCSLLIIALVFWINFQPVFGADLNNKTGGTVDKLYVLWSQKNNSKIAATLSISADGGNTFSSPKNILNNTGISGFPSRSALSVHNDMIYVVGETDLSGNSEILLSYSNDSGKTFSSPKNISNNNGTSGDPVVTTSGNNTYVVWQDNSPGNSEILLSYSNDSGKTFSSPKNISNNNGTSGDPVVTTSGNNTYIVWRDDIVNKNKNPTLLNSGIFFSVSSDGGKTFSSPKNIGDDTNVNSQSPSIDAAGNNVYASWNEAMNWTAPPNFIVPQNYEILLSYSNDSGKTFSSPKNISNDNGIQDKYPSIAAAGNNVYASWMLDNYPPFREIFFSFSSDSGKTFSSPDIISSNLTEASENPSIAAAGNNTYVVWQDNVQTNTTSNSEILLSYSNDSGKTFSSPKNISNNKEGSSFPTIVVAARGPGGSVNLTDSD